MLLSFKTLLSKYPYDFLKLSSLGFGLTVGNVVTALIVKQVFDRFLMSEVTTPIENLYVFAAILVIIAITTGYFCMLERIWAECLGQRIVHDLRIKIFRHLTKVYPRVLEQKNKGGLHLRLVNDLTAIRQWAALGLSRIIVSGISIVLTILALAFTNLTLAGLVFFFVVIGVATSIFLGPVLRYRVSELRRRRANLANNVGEKIDAMQTVQVFGRERSEIKKIKRQSSSLVNAALSKTQMIGILRGSIIALTGFATMGTLIAGSFLVLSGQTTPGTVAAAIVIVGLLIPPLRDFGRIYEYWISFNVAVEKISQTLDLKTARLKGKNRSKAKDFQGEIEYRNVTVKNVFSNFSAKVLPGDKVVITGSNGAGKSTLLSLLLGTTQPKEGSVLIDGKCLKKWDIRSLRSHVGIVSPDLPLLRGTLRNNLLYRRNKACNETLQNAMDLSGLSEKLAQFSEGLDTPITERGKDFSSGERQTFALARALLGMPEILLLDEAESNLDASTKEIIIRLIKTYPGTVLAISHDPEIIRIADNLWELSPERAIQRSA